MERRPPKNILLGKAKLPRRGGSARQTSSTSISSAPHYFSTLANVAIWCNDCSNGPCSLVRIAPRWLIATSLPSHALLRSENRWRSKRLLKIMAHEISETLTWLSDYLSYLSYFWTTNTAFVRLCTALRALKMPPPGAETFEGS